MEDLFWPVAFLWQHTELIAPILIGILDWWILTINRWEKPIQKFVDGRLLPPLGVRVRSTQPGAKIRFCLGESKEATVWWEVPRRAVVILSFTTILGVAIVTLTQLGKWMTGNYTDPQAISANQAIWFWALFSFGALIVVPGVYHRRRFIQRTKRLVYTDDDVHFIRGKPTLLGFLFKFGKNYFYSRTDPWSIPDLMIAPDPQDLDPRYRTSVWRDAWTRYWAGREDKDVASLFIPATAFGGSDHITYVEKANEAAQTMAKVRKEIELLRMTRSQAWGSAVAARVQIALSQQDYGAALAAYQEGMRNADGLLTDIAAPEEFDILLDIPVGVWPDGFAIGAKSPQPVADDEIRKKYEDLFPQETSTPTTVKVTDEPKDFVSLWSALPRKLRKRLAKAGIAKDLATLIHQETGTGPQALLELVEEGLSAPLILQRLGVFGKADGEGVPGGKSGILPEYESPVGKKGLRRPKKPPEPPSGGKSPFLRDEDSK